MLQFRIRVILALCVAASETAGRGVAPKGATYPQPAPQRRCSALLAFGLAGINQLDTLGPCAHLIAGRGPVDVDFQVLENHLDIPVRGVNLLLPVDTYADFVKTMVWHGDSVPISGNGVGPLALAVRVGGDDLNQQRAGANAPGVNLQVSDLQCSILSVRERRPTAPSHPSLCAQAYHLFPRCSADYMVSPSRPPIQSRKLAVFG